MSDNSRMTNVPEFIGDLNGGVFEQLVGRFLSDSAMGVVTNDNKTKGKVVLTFDLERMADSHQVMVTHKIEATVPTRNGKVIEHNTTKTPMYVNRGGRITHFPETQGNLFESKASTENA